MRKWLSLTSQDYLGIERMQAGFLNIPSFYAMESLLILVCIGFRLSID